MDALVAGAEAFIQVFRTAADVFVGFTTGIIPIVVVFLPEKNKPAFYDAAVSFVHPITGIFPHANGGELFVWLGIAAGVEMVAPDMVTALAVRYLLAGLVVI